MTGAALAPQDGIGAAERARFAALQAQFAASYTALFDDPGLPRTVVIVPSLSLDPEVLAKVSGVHHYEERMLCLLLLLRMPRTRVIYLTSTAISETIIDYYLHLLPGVPGGHARARLTLLSCDDASAAPLTQKILARPRLLGRLRAALAQGGPGHLSCFTVSELERRLALALGLPIYGCDPALSSWGSKSGSRRIFKEVGIDLPDGFEDLSDAGALTDALTELKRRRPELRKAVVKLNEGFSGEGNAIIDLSAAPDDHGLPQWLRDRLPDMAFEARGMSWEIFEAKLRGMGGIVEEFIPGHVKQSPSAQLRIDPLGRVDAVSTHDQVLGGPSGQIFLGCRFPADGDYRRDIQARGMAVAEALARKGVIGRLGVDFISVRDGPDWRHVAIEINLRKGGTTHPFLMLQFLTDGRYDPGSGEFLTPAGQPRCYYASDNLESRAYRGLTPDDLVDIAVVNGLHFHAAAGEGVAFHLIGALSEFGKLGVVCIGQTHVRAAEFYRRTVSVLDAAY
ncbi:carboxylate-amine ligase [Bradyrhizobium sp. 83012]|uniref:Carboxylate-amine ligase n=1 Tax=Bradyrhizobium aeschynomenes TaxID=2734909 RepID=A0ABX2C9G9_9BRAD|nr:peptide ligase PGM1-related protein [Bradyrhizobium aeschynomenes]NPU64408.1 carboxylate-amine ligase [Bradyrhizobium aeschynomenes]